MKDSAPIQGVKKILIIRNDGIGDVLNSTPAISALRDAYQDAHISVVVRPPGAEVLILNPHIDQILIYDRDSLHRSLKSRWRFFRQLRDESYDMVVVLRNSSQSNFMAYVSGARYRVGRRSERKRFSSTLTHAVTSRDPKGTKHEIDRNMDIVHLVGVVDGSRDLVLRLSEEEQVWAQDFILKAAQPRAPLLVGIHPGGSSFDKLWPAENFAGVADRLIQDFDAKIMIFSGHGEDDLVRSIQESMTHSPILAAGLQLRQFAALVAECSLFLCNDSGPMHIAAALKVPTVAIFGPTDHVRWKPRNENAVVVKRDMDCWPCSAHKCKRVFECTKLLPVKDVWNAIINTI